MSLSFLTNQAMDRGLVKAISVPII